MTCGSISFNRLVGTGSLSHYLDVMIIMTLVTSSSISGSNSPRVGACSCFIHMIPIMAIKIIPDFFEFCY